MKMSCDIAELELLCVIVNFGMGSKVLKYAKKGGISGGTILVGRGTVNNPILELLALTDTRKEIVLMISVRETVDRITLELNQKFMFQKPNHGIAFAMPVSDFLGSRNCRCIKNIEGKGEEKTMYNAIFVIVDKGKAEEVIEAANKAGSRGGTIINARGSGIHETSKLFSMDIEPEKEVVLMLSESNKTDAITESIRTHLQMDQPGNGILFVQNVSLTCGLY